MKAVHAFVLVLCCSLSTGCAQMMAKMSGPGVTDEDPGRRTIGMVVEDENIETKILGNLYKADPRFRDSHLSIESYNGVVLMAGQVVEAGMISRAGDIAKQMRGVRNVHNVLQVSQPAAFSTRSQDAWIQSKIKTIMYATRDFPASRVKVVTESGVVYLMGLVTQAEANEAVSIIKDINGIKRIVKIFEYISPGQQVGNTSATPSQPPPRQGVPYLPTNQAPASSTATPGVPNIDDVPTNQTGPILPP